MAGTIKAFLPDAVAAYKIVKKLGPKAVLTQVLTGHGGFSEYLYRYKCKESPSCVCDSEEDETLLHVVLSCPVHAKDRYNLEQKKGCVLKKEELSEIMRREKDRKELIEYCMRMANIVIKRNRTRDI